MLIDTHAHLDFSDDLDGWLAGAKSEGVTKIICVGTSVDASGKCAEIAQEYSSKDLQIYATCGIHAQDGKDDIKNSGSLYQCINTLKQIASDSNKVVAIGECGLDVKVISEKLKVISEQRELFEGQIKLAEELKLPLIIHCRNAFDETFDLLSVVNGQLSNVCGLFHSWTGNWEAAQTALNLGFYISFSGIVTFKNAPDVQEVAKKIPLDRVLIETDSPFLSPEPLRGKQNEPKNVRIVAEFIARLRNLPVDQIASVTSNNAGRLFGI
jgi:TatD DNase family protein